MKKIFFLLSMIFIFCYAKAQNVLKVEYESVMTPNLGNINLSEEHRKALLQELAKPEKRLLYCTQGNSFFTNQNPSEIELTRSETQKGNQKKVETNTLKKAHIKHFRVKGKNGMYIYRNYNGDEYYEHYEPVRKKIEYKEETQQIDDFTCKLAEITTDRNILIKVWYTEDIALPFGPSYYYDFPGLVLKVEAPDFTIYATKVTNDAKFSEVEQLNPKLKIYEGEALKEKRNQVRKENAKPKVKRKVIRL